MLCIVYLLTSNKSTNLAKINRHVFYKERLQYYIYVQWCFNSWKSKLRLLDETKILNFPSEYRTSLKSSTYLNIFNWIFNRIYSNFLIGTLLFQVYMQVIDGWSGLRSRALIHNSLFLIFFMWNLPYRSKLRKLSLQLSWLSQNQGEL